MLVRCRLREGASHHRKANADQPISKSTPQHLHHATTVTRQFLRAGSGPTHLAAQHPKQGAGLTAIATYGNTALQAGSSVAAGDLNSAGDKPEHVHALWCPFQLIRRLRPAVIHSCIQRRLASTILAILQTLVTSRGPAKTCELLQKVVFALTSVNSPIDVARTSQSWR